MATIHISVNIQLGTLLKNRKGVGYTPMTTSALRLSWQTMRQEELALIEISEFNAPAEWAMETMDKRIQRMTRELQIEQIKNLPESYGQTVRLPTICKEPPRRRGHRKSDDN